ncbi:hypothetical protein [uncultured Gimesia sp.]|jgi:ABC-type Zn uptake system ZnuABC Zn-binding protein ZnuA|uniref:hypothetical protein n=1 Tax=uncultured Gimesia sp. TaxID=1678688 RepID=UPI00262E2B18|nr:hypothetical protein [uncultured Gimesia sp.]
MARIRFVFILLLGLILVAGCGRSASPPKASEPMSPEEAALDIVTAIYTISASVNEAGPENWETLETYASGLQDPARQNALDAIKKIKSLDYKVTWGVNMSAIKEQYGNASEFVILESPDGQLRATFGGKILKRDKAKDHAEVDPKTITSEKEATSSDVSP